MDGTWDLELSAMRRRHGARRPRPAPRRRWVLPFVAALVLADLAYMGVGAAARKPKGRLASFKARAWRR